VQRKSHLRATIEAPRCFNYQTLVIRNKTTNKDTKNLKAPKLFPTWVFNKISR